jgi:hypothetical protein
VPPAPKPQYGTYGFDCDGNGPERCSGRQLLPFANGTWAKNTPIPADKSSYGSFNILDDLSRERTRDVIQEESKDPNSRIGSAYASFMDQSAIESKGLAPFDPWLNQVRSIKSKKGLPALYGDADGLGINVPFNMFVGQDRKASGSIYSERPPGRPRNAGPRLLSVGRPEDCRDPGKISRPFDQHADARARKERGGAREGNRRFRNQDREGPLDQGRQPRRHQDL